MNFEPEFYMMGEHDIREAKANYVSRHKTVGRWSGRVSVIGTGELAWSPYERKWDRYGFVGLFHQQNPTRLSMARNGKTGRLVAEVIEPRESQHLGDWAHGVFPTKPEKGERVFLGEGTLCFDEYQVGVVPADGRDLLILDIHGLYRVHSSIVKLIFEE